MTTYFFVALILIGLGYFFVAKSYQTVFKMLKINRTIWETLKLKMTSTAVSVVVPTAGLSSMVVYAEDSKRKGHSIPATICAAIMSYISDYTSTSIFLVISMIYLLFLNTAIPYVLIPAVIFLFITFLTYFVSILAGKGSKKLKVFIGKFLKIMAKPLKLTSKKSLNVDKLVDSLYREFERVNKAILRDPKDWLITIFYSSLQHLFYIVSLYLIFLSFGVAPHFSVILAAYSVAAVFVVVSPTPSGIGFVEGAYFFMFKSFDINTTIATTVVLIYRFLTFWLPLFIGFLLYQRNKIKDLMSEIEILETE